MDEEMQLLKEKYKPVLKIGVKSIEELEGYLQTVATITPMDENALYKSTLGPCCTAYVDNLRIQGKPVDDLQFVAYRLEHEEQNKLYLFDYFESMLEGFPVVVFEKTTGWLDSDCGLLKLELFVQRGISKCDYDNETSAFYLYLMYYDGYINACKRNGRKI